MSDEGSDGSPVRPARRRIKKVMVVSSASETDSDASVGPIPTRRRRLRALTDDDGSESSGSSVGARPKRTLPVLRDSDAGSDWSGAGDTPRPTVSTAKPNSGFASDSSEGNSDKCSICLLRFKEQEIGTPEVCEHIFCLDCITEWAKNVNTCPVDRITFNSIVVRACAGGRVLRTEPVKVEERRPSVEFLVIDDHTPCQVCNRTDREETMLLCDGCDLGYHMQCLTPPLSAIPLDHWLCPNCDDLLEEIHDLSGLDDLFDEVIDVGPLEMLSPRPSALRQPRTVRRQLRHREGEASTSSDNRGGATQAAPSTSSGAGTTRAARNTARAPPRRRTATKRRKNKRRRTLKTIIIEYDVEVNGKFPVTKTVKRTVKKRKSRKKQSRTAARRSHVRASVRARLATMHVDAPSSAQAAAALAGAAEPVSELHTRRRRAGIPSLSLFGDPNQLEFFEEEEYDVYGGPTAAVAVRPSSSMASAYRQARRKMINIPSPPHAAPDLLASIMDSQSLLHSKGSVVSVSVDGKLNIKPKPGPRKDITHKSDESRSSDDRLNLSKGEDATKKTPSYPGKGRSGGWGGGYQGNYHREHGTGNFSRGGYEAYGAPSQAPAPAPFPQRANNEDSFDSQYGPRQLQFYDEDYQYDRPRRPLDNGRGNFPNQRTEHDRGPNFSNQRHEMESPDMDRTNYPVQRNEHGLFDPGRGPNFPNQRHEHGPLDTSRGPNFPNLRHEHGPLDTGRGPNFPNQRHEHGPLDIGRGPNFPNQRHEHGPLDTGRGPNFPNQRHEHGPLDTGRGPNFPNQRHEHGPLDTGRGPNFPNQRHEHGPVDTGRGPNFPNQRHEHGPHDIDRGPSYSNQRFGQGTDTGRGNSSNQRHERHSVGSWQPYEEPTSRGQETLRHSFSEIEDALDMRTGHAPPGDHGSLPEPPEFNLDTSPEPESSFPVPHVFKVHSRPADEDEDERSDPGLVIDTDKYDPTDPTQDSDDENKKALRLLMAGSLPSPTDLSSSMPSPLGAPSPPLISLSQTTADQSPLVTLSSTTEPVSLPSVLSLNAPPTPPVPPLPAPPSPPVFPLSSLPSPPRFGMQSILAGIDTSSLNVPANVLDDAVRQVLEEHRSLLAPSAARSRNDRSDEDSDGDCPNFSIYSATSVHIASGAPALPRQATPDNLDEDLVQQDGVSSPGDNVESDTDAHVKKDEPEESATLATPNIEEIRYKMLSKKCPITSNTRNPIKIKLQTQTLIKRNISLYDEDDDADVDAEPEKVEAAPETHETKSWTYRSPKKAKDERSSKRDSSKKDSSKKDSSNKDSVKRNKDLTKRKSSRSFEKRKGRKNDESKTHVSHDKEKKDTTELDAPEHNIEKEDTTETNISLNRADKEETTETDASPKKLETEESDVSHAEKKDSSKTDVAVSKQGALVFGYESADDADEGHTPDHGPLDDRQLTPDHGPLDDRQLTPDHGPLDDRQLTPHADRDDNVEELNADRDVDGDKTEKETACEESDDDAELELIAQKSKRDSAETDENVEKMTESISETEDERSYTPCLDENKSKDLETDKGIEGLDTEMISEEEANDIFSDGERAAGRQAAVAPAAPTPSPVVERAATPAEEVPEKPDADAKKKKKKESKKESKGKIKKAGVTFKKLTKSGKERNYRERDKEERRGKRERERERRSSADSEERRRRKEKRKDLERYDVRSVVTDKRRKGKDAFGRDVSPPPAPAAASPPRRKRKRSGSQRHQSGSPLRGSMSPRQRYMSPRRRSISSPFDRSISPRRRSMSPLPSAVLPLRRAISPLRRAISPLRRAISPLRRAISPRRTSVSPHRSISSYRGAISPRRRSISPRRRSISPRRRSISPRRKSISPRRMPGSPRRQSVSPRRRSGSRVRKASPPPRRAARKRARRSASRSIKQKATKKKKRTRSEREPSQQRRRKTKKKRAKRAERSPPPPPPPAAPRGWSPPSVDSRLLSPCTPPAALASPPSPAAAGRWRAADALRCRRRAAPAAGPSKEVFTSGDNILVSVSFKEQEADGAEKRKRRERRRKRRRAADRLAGADPPPRPVAIIDLERSPFREVTPSPKHVIVLSDDEQVDKAQERPAPAPAPAAPEPQPAPAFAVGPKTPPEPTAAARAIEEPAAPLAGPATPRDPEPDSPDAYDPFEPTRSASASPRAGSPQDASSPPRAHMTLEAAQKTNMSADDVLDRRPISPIEKVLALLKSTRNVTPDRVPPSPAASPGPPPAPAAPAPAVMPAPLTVPPAPAAAPAAPAPPPVRIVLPSPTRAQAPKLFLTKPSPIKSNPVKPMQATKISRLPLPRRPPPDLELSPGADSPYSPGSEDFSDLFSPPAGAHASRHSGKGDIFDELFDKPPPKRKKGANVAKVPVKLKKKGRTQVGVSVDENSLKVMDELPSSAVEMQVKSKFLTKLNRQERVVEEVKLVLKPHYNKKHVTKDEYKDIMRRAVPKICHNKTGEINPAKIQSLVQAYVKKCRKRHKLGLV